MIVDCHCHAGSGDGLTSPRGSRLPVATFLRRARVAGIDQVNLLPAFQRDYAAANRELFEFVRRSAEPLSAFAFVHPRRDAGNARRMVGRAVMEYGFRGIKVHRHDGKITDEICDAAREHAVPVLYDVMGKVGDLEALANEHPDIEFIIPHLGSYADDWRAQTRLIDYLVDYPNFYADTSGVRRFDVLEKAVYRAGARKFLFGTDGPWCHPAVELAKVRHLRLGDRDEALVLGENFLRLTRAPSTAQAPAPAPRGRAWVLRS